MKSRNLAVTAFTLAALASGVALAQDKGPPSRAKSIGRGAGPVSLDRALGLK